MPTFQGLRVYDYYTSAPTASYETTTLVADLSLLVLGGLLFSAMLLVLKYRRRAQRAKAAVSSTNELRPGPITLRGYPEPEGNHPMVVTTISQKATEAQSKGSWSHIWAETGRETEAYPFYLRLSSGDKVRVEPSGKVELIDKLDKIDRFSHELRRLVATLTPDELTCVSGELIFGVDPRAEGQPYRGAGKSLVLRPSRGESMLVSTEPPEERYLNRARFYLKWVVGFELAIVLYALILGSFQLLRFCGEVVMAQQPSVDTYQTYFKPKNGAGYYVPHYTISAVYTDKEGKTHPVKDETSRGVYNDVKNGATKMPFVVVSGFDTISQVGLRPSMVRDWVIGVVMFLIVLLVAYPMSIKGSLPWYLTKMHYQTGQGRIPPMEAQT